MITTGSSAGFNLAFLAPSIAGDRIALAAPGYPAYRNILAALGPEVVDIETTAAARHVITPGCSPRRIAVSRSPAFWSRARPIRAAPDAPEALAALIAAAEAERHPLHLRRDLPSASSMMGSPTTALQFSTRRDHRQLLLQVLLHDRLADRLDGAAGGSRRPVERLAQNLYISPPDISQRAAIAAFDATAELEAVKAGYAANRELLLARLPAIGFDDYLPVDGAFYVYAWSAASRTIGRVHPADARRGRRRGHAGTGFRPARGHSIMRFLFAGTEADMAEAMDRLERWLK